MTSNHIHIKSGMAAASTKVTVGETGVEVKGIYKIELVAEPGETWKAVIHCRPQAIEMDAFLSEIKERLDKLP